MDASDRRRRRTVVKIGKLPVNFIVGAYYNLIRPEYGADWQLRTQVTFIF